MNEGIIFIGGVSGVGSGGSSSVIVLYELRRMGEIRIIKDIGDKKS